MSKWGLYFIALLVVYTLPASAVSYKEFTKQLIAESKERGLDYKLVEKALGFPPISIPKAIKKSKKQPEFFQTFQWYLSKIVSPHRINTGVEKFKSNKRDVLKASKKYDIPPQVIISLWGVESTYGKDAGKFPMLPSLATLAWKSHRPKFFKKEFFAAVKIVQDKHIELKDFTGSWAGAMGQCQFMPTSFLAYAQDGNGDGKKDIWQTKADVFASTANYLKQHNWQQNASWGQQVVLTKILPKLKLNRGQLSESRPLKYWQKLGVIHTASNPFPPKNTKARLFMPQGPSKKSYLVYKNFDVIMRWNNSTAFAFSVLNLADKIAAKI